jgi:hypothetical protein
MPTWKRFALASVVVVVSAGPVVALSAFKSGDREGEAVAYACRSALVEHDWRAVCQLQSQTAYVGRVERR